jgi:quinone-modifying oxidoreductase, subunit QmoA
MSNNSVLVVGGGFSGITAALEAAEVGYEVYIVEKLPYLGGRVAQLNQYFPKLCPPSCGLEIQFQRIKKNPKVHVLTLAEVASVSGGPGAFEVKLTLSPRHVNANCTCCGACAEAATTLVDSEFDFGLGKRKPAYLPALFAYPQRYVIEKDACGKSELEAISEACVYDAVDLDEAAKELTLNVGAIVWATGWQPYDVTKLSILGAGQVPNVVSNMQMERLAAPNGPTGGEIQCADGSAPKSVAFVQCAGSRDENHLSFCSYICCMASLKQATYVRTKNPDADVTIYYIDLRTPGRYEKFLARIRDDEKVRFVKGKVADVAPGEDGKVLITVENAVDGVKMKVAHDLVVLATGMQPSAAGQVLPAGVVADAEGFVQGDPDQGIISCGCAKKPLDVMRSAQTATGAALKAIQTVLGR